MDELEFREAYNEACTAAEKITAPETKIAVSLVLQLVNALNVRITEIVEQWPDEC